jgi:hypothetical protein
MDENERANLTNWGRWGAEDQLGSLNLITPEIIRKAAGPVKTGKTYSLSVPLEANGPQWPLRPKIWRVTAFKSDPSGWGSSGDAVMLHSHSGAHIDALCHVWYGHRLYNGYSVAEHVTSYGIGRNAIDNVRFIVGRGVLLDIATWKGVDHLDVGEAVTASDLDQCAAAQNVTLQSGDPAGAHRLDAGSRRIALCSTAANRASTPPRCPG